MAGTLFGLPLSQQMDANGRPMSGCLLYIYTAGTTTPAVAYQDYGLTGGLELPWPMAADANGRIPQFWLNDGSYRARLTDSVGTVQFDLPNVLALGASSGDGGGGGGGGVDANAIFQTGDTLFVEKAGSRSGFVRDNGRTIGSASSGASERANADCEALFAFYWNNFSNSLCAVSGGRGANAAADWSANKTIATLDKRGRAAVGLDDMGNSAASRISSATFTVGNATTAGSQGGAATHTLTTSELASHTHTGTSGNMSANSSHTHSVSSTQGGNIMTAGGGGTLLGQLSSGFGVYVSAVSADSTNTDHTHSFTTDGSGSGSAHNNMQPFITGTWHRKL